MRQIKVVAKKHICKFCKSEMNVSGRAYLANPFCNKCYEDRLESSGAIDLRDNYRLEILNDSYSKIEPIDKNKKFVKTKK
ncbi:hypothetical protein COJ01_17685 [Priestia megaterium]|uniref:hypothetical protein n=1 Tax=Priestia megaterium TaxID=1404 RepID=UPI000BF7965B|nr:hypothetical protein [Priestia megaterium]PFK99894.1 hypothetical protein COJ01_17685 [Priestia megaterium]